MRAFLIAEKPDAAKKVAAVYDKIGYKDEINFSSALGHLVGLANPKDYGIESWGKWTLESIPMIPEKFKYEVDASKSKQFNLLKKELTSGKYDYVINACDAGREGELIFQLIYDHAKCKLPVKRLWLSEFTDKGIKDALDKLRDDKELINMKNAAKSRQWFDWLLGMNLSKIVIVKTGENTSIGRVVTPTLAMVVERELEIQNFKPTPFWEIDADFGAYTGTWFDKDSKETRILEEKKARELKSKLGKKGKILNIEEKVNSQVPKGLHSLGELQKEANKVFGYSLAETLVIAQSLYETHKLLTYPRTDSQFLNANLSAEFPKILERLKSVSEVSAFVSIANDPKRMNSVAKNKKYVDDSKVSDHHAIIPTQEKANLSRLSKEERNVYMLVVKRFLSIFLDPYKTSSTNIITEIDSELFKSTAKTLVDLGYKALYPSNQKDDEIPQVKQNDIVDVKKIDIKTKQTNPPNRYNAGSLLGAMESAGKFLDDKELQKTLREIEGIGTPATRASIVEKLVSLKLICEEKKQYFATESGVKLITQLEGQDIISPALTATWESKLKDLEKGNYDKDLLLKEIKDYTKKVSQDFLNINTFERKNSSLSNKTSLGVCPKCKKNIVEGKDYYLCEGYKQNCDFIVGKTKSGAKITKVDIKALLTKGQTKEMSFTFSSGKTGKTTLNLNEKGEVVFGFALNGNSNYNNKDNKDNKEINKDKEVIGKCPKCKGNVVDAKNYYLCEHYKDSCDFVSGKSYNGVDITKTELKKMLTGKESKEFEFTWKSGKKGKSTLMLEDGKIIYSFASKNKK